MDTDGCVFWSHASNRGICDLKAANDFEMRKKKGDTSGSVLGECGAPGVKLEEMVKCNCVKNPSEAYLQIGGGTPSGPISPRVSPVIGSKIGARYVKLTN